MLTNSDIENKLRALKPVLSEKYFVERIGYFGSFSRGEQTKEPDIDILVEFRQPPGWEFFDLQEFLKDELKLNVDLISIKALKKQFKETILSQTRYV